MAVIATFVFFDIETTGLPHQERNRTKIIEASFVAALRRDIECTELDYIPPVSKLTYVLNPQRPICAFSSELTGFTNKLLKHAPIFKQKFASLCSFLNDLPAPVCLVAHNGTAFDFKILLAECNDAGVKLPENLLCLDSLISFRRLLKGSNICYNTLKPAIVEQDTGIDDDLLTDDEDSENNFNVNDTDDEWPDLDISDDEWADWDQSDNELKTVLEEKRDDLIKNVLKNKCKKESFKLGDLYQRLLNKKEENAHRAEVDCMMLLQCVVALKDQFITWADENCKPLTEIKPLIRK